MWPAVREGLGVLLGSPGAFGCVGKYGNAEDMLANLVADQPDILLMDIGLPGMSGIEVTRRVKQERPAAEVVILTVRFPIRNIYRKLHVHSRTAAVAKAVKEDLI